MKPRQQSTKPAGEVLLELETVLEALIDDHDMQWGDVLALTYSWLMVHRPAARETYTDSGKHPEYHYGPERGEK